MPDDPYENQRFNGTCPTCGQPFLLEDLHQYEELVRSLVEQIRRMQQEEKTERTPEEEDSGD